jgi:hypothetical protein
MRKTPDKLGQSGAIAQMGERLLCKQEVTGSIPVGSTRKPCKLASFGKAGKTGRSRD